MHLYDLHVVIWNVLFPTISLDNQRIAYKCVIEYSDSDAHFNEKANEGCICLCDIWMNDFLEIEFIGIH